MFKSDAGPVGPLRRLQPQCRDRVRCVAGGRDGNRRRPRTSACTSPPCGPALRKEDVRSGRVEKERRYRLREAALKEGKPANIVDKMVEGRLRNFYAERVLCEQPFVRAIRTRWARSPAEGRPEVRAIRALGTGTGIACSCASPRQVLPDCSLAARGEAPAKTAPVSRPAA